MMVKKILALTVILLLTGCATLDGMAGNPQPPITSLREIPNTAYPATTYCGVDQPVMILNFPLEETPYRFIYAPGSKRAILLSLADGEDTPVWFGHLADDHITFVVDQYFPYSEAGVAYPDPCAFLAPEMA